MSLIDQRTVSLERFTLALAASIPDAPKSLYDPVRHMIGAGGKRVRPMLTALCYHLTKQDEGWIDAGIAIELLHTFTLVHDDIMDNAATRRGHPTVHATFGTNEAILSGDVMIALAQQALGSLKYERASEMLTEFSNGFIRVCEGQALDKDFEQQHDITIPDYIRMIDLKTAKILESAATLGVLAANDMEHIESVRSFAHHVGIAFQIQDDLLDLTTEHADFGKTIGGDILEGKRTYLLLKLVERRDALGNDDRSLLERVLSRKASTSDIAPIRSVMQKTGILAETSDAVAEHTELAMRALGGIDADTTGLHDFAEWLLRRSY